ncbi:MAG: glycosyltransferase, partial [Gemmatimonadota bacterium]|nr:glycosyltransferase [Gemmatimonadota bacterium]
MLSVVFFLDNLDVGGTELAALRMARYLNPDHVQLRVIALRADGPLRAEFLRLGIEVVSLPVSGLARPDTVRAAWTMLGLLGRWRVDVLHAFDPYTNILGVPVARAAGVPRVVASHRWWDGVHGRSLERVNAAVVRLAHRLVANSPRVGQRAIENGVSPRRVAVVPNFVEPEFLLPPDPAWVIEQRRALGVPEGVPVVGTVASLSWLKGHRTLMGALAHGSALEAVRLIFVGDGPERRALEELASSLDIRDRVHFAGRRP